MAHGTDNTLKSPRVGLEITPSPTHPRRAQEFVGVHMTIHQHMNRLKGALGWSVVGIALAYVLFAAAAGAIAR